ncbi:hypothetical protein [Arthrobacter sp. LjRoot78]|uniref:hypothetical protein n=1 Tax=Arthrobacter sp. LjRoot78 TaxID=3342338 RepID=UPI003F503FC5
MKLALALVGEFLVGAATSRLITGLIGGESVGVALIGALVGGVLSVFGFFGIRAAIASRRRADQAKEAWLKNRATSDSPNRYEQEQED